MGSIDAGAQERVSVAVLDSVRPFLGGPHPDGDEWRFEFGEHLESNWGAVYGGALAAGTLALARAVAPGRSPRSLHIQIVRSVPSGLAYATAGMRHSGRTVGTVEVDLYDHRRKLAAIALVTMVTPGAVAAEHHDTGAAPEFHIVSGPNDPDASTVRAPITAALNLDADGKNRTASPFAENLRRGIGDAMASVGECTVPWEDLDLTGPEVACLAADAMVALPVMQSSTIPFEKVGPNADLTLRFSTAPASRVVSVATTMLSLQHGTATVGIEVQAGDQQLAHGLATSLLLPTEKLMGMDQETATRVAIESVQEFLGGPHPDGDGWRYDFGEHLESNWGAVYGGALAAGTLTVARCIAPDRSPRSLHLQMVRSVPRGVARVTASVRHPGRTVTTLEVEMHDERGKLAVLGLVTMVAPDAVAAEYHDTSTTPFRVGEIPAPIENISFVSPIVDSLQMLPFDDGTALLLQVQDALPNVDGSVATGVQVVLPWENLELTGPEAACLAADAAVGSPVLNNSFIPQERLGPNPDLSLRFTTAPATRLVLAAGSMLSVQHGTATVAIEVRAGANQLAHGLSTSLLLPPQ